MSTDITEIELLGVETQRVLTRVLDKEFSDAELFDVPTAFGAVKVAVQGKLGKPAILTCHDIGLNHATCFQGFFHCSDIAPMLDHFTIYHYNVPGQHEGAGLLPTGYVFPTMDEIADNIAEVMAYFNLKQIIGFGFGAGANILSRLALKDPTKTEALVLVNCCSRQCSWLEWGYQKYNGWYLKSGSMTSFTEDYLLWHWFGRHTKDANTDLVHVYRENVKTINPINLAHFIDSYIARTDLGIERCLDETMKDNVCTLKCQVLLVSGDYGPMLDDCVDMNSRLDPSCSSLLKLADCGGMVLEEQPARLAEAFRFFLQGMGYIPFISHARMLAERAAHKAMPTEKGDPPTQPGAAIQPTALATARC